MGSGLHERVLDRFARLDRLDVLDRSVRRVSRFGHGGHVSIEFGELVHGAAGPLVGASLLVSLLCA